MNPPIREKYHQDRLWQAVKNNEVSIIGSDHAPHTKRKNPNHTQKAHLEFRSADNFSLMLNAALSGKLTINQLVKYMVKNPVNIFKIKNKG